MDKEINLSISGGKLKPRAIWQAQRGLEMHLMPSRFQAETLGLKALGAAGRLSNGSSLFGSGRSRRQVSPFSSGSSRGSCRGPRFHSGVAAHLNTSPPVSQRGFRPDTDSSGGSRVEPERVSEGSHCDLQSHEEDALSSPEVENPLVFHDQTLIIAIHSPSSGDGDVKIRDFPDSSAATASTFEESYSGRVPEPVATKLAQEPDSGAEEATPEPPAPEAGELVTPEEAEAAMLSDRTHYTACSDPFSSKGGLSVNSVPKADPLAQCAFQWEWADSNHRPVRRNPIPIHTRCEIIDVPRRPHRPIQFVEPKRVPRPMVAIAPAREEPEVPKDCFARLPWRHILAALLMVGIVVTAFYLGYKTGKTSENSLSKTFGTSHRRLVALEQLVGIGEDFAVTQEKF